MSVVPSMPPDDDERVQAIVKARSDVVHAALALQCAEDEVARIKVQLRTAQEHARWAKTIHHVAALVLRRAMEGR